MGRGAFGAVGRTGAVGQDIRRERPVVARSCLDTFPLRSPMARCSRIASPDVRRRRYFAAVHPWAAICGNILARCVPGWPSVARNCSDAFSGALPWQFFRLMHPKKGLGREKRPSLATYRRRASKTSWLWQYSRAMYPKGAANRLSGMHSAQILPGRGPFRRTDPSNHALRTNPAIPPAPPNSASAAAPAPSARPIALKRGPEADVTRPTAAPRTARALAAPALPASNRHAAFSERGASLALVAIKVAVAFRLPYARRLTAPVFCALGSCDRHINARQSPFYAIISLWLRKNRLPSGKTQALPIQWVGCSRGHVPYRTINKEKRLRWQLLHIALSARKRRKW